MAVVDNWGKGWLGMKILYGERELNEAVIDLMYTENDKEITTIVDYRTLNYLINNSETDGFKVKFKREWLWIVSNKMDDYNLDGTVRLSERRFDERKG
jgi:hypothetical protein